MTAVTPLYAARNLAFAPTLELEYLGDPLPLEGATMSMEVRLYPGASGDPLATASSVTFEDEDAATAEEPTLRILRIFPVIDREDLEALPGLNQPEAGSAQTFYQEIKITYADNAQDSAWISEFILEPGVNVQ